jgi:hypothetical protein
MSKLINNTRQDSKGKVLVSPDMDDQIITQMHVIGVVGSRRRNSGEDRQLVYLTIHHHRQCIGGNTILVSGGCPQGADLFAEEYAEMHRLPIIRHLPDQTQLRKSGSIHSRQDWAKIAYARNTLIANDADILIACVAPDRKGGTEDTIKKFRKRLGFTEAQAISEGKLILV